MSQTKFRPRGRPRAKDADEKTDRILSKAAELFAAQGFNKTSFASVADAVGLSLPGLTHYFPRKIDLLQAVLDDRDEEMFRDGQALRGKNQFESLDAVMRRDTGSGAELTQLFAVLSAEALSEDHPAHGWFKKRYAKTLDTVRNGLLKMQKNGQIKPDVDCHAEAASVLAMMEGLQIWWLRMPHSSDPTERFAAYLDSLKLRILA